MREVVNKLGEKQREFLLLTHYTGAGLILKHIDLTKGVLRIHMTKNGQLHSLPITPMMREILEWWRLGLELDAVLFKGVSAELRYRMAMRLDSPRFVLHDLGNLVATIGEELGLGDTVLRRILKHTAPKTDALRRHYVGLNEGDVAGALVAIREELVVMMQNTRVNN
jgi:hypothetical protein